MPKNTKQWEMINNLILERSNRTKSKTHVSERELSSQRSSNPRVELVDSRPIIEEVPSPKLAIPPKSNDDLLLKEDKLLKFTYFNGKKDPKALLSWIRTFKTYFEGKTLPDRIQIRFVVLHFIGDANIWWEAQKV